MRRRTFLKVTGMAGILAAHRAPAFAQGTKLHIRAGSISSPPATSS